MAKRPGSLVLTFSKKNTDIRKLLEDKKTEEESFIATDYICEAIRFYEKHKISGELYNKETIERLIDERLKKFVGVNSAVTLGLVEPEKVIKEKIVTNVIKTNENSLESNLDGIPIDED